MLLTHARLVGLNN